MSIDTGKVCALVTGASSGTGEAIARKLAHSGVRVALQYFRNELKAKQLAIELGNNSFAIGADLSSPIATRKLFKEVIATAGRLDILINNADTAVSSFIDDESWINDWEEMMAINLRAPAILSRQAIKYFLRSQIPGRIVNVAARASVKIESPEYIAYAASKAGLVSLSHSITDSFKKEGILSFVVDADSVRIQNPLPWPFYFVEDRIIDDSIFTNRTIEEKLASDIVAKVLDTKHQAGVGYSDSNASCFPE